MVNRIMVSTRKINTYSHGHCKRYLDNAALLSYSHSNSTSSRRHGNYTSRLTDSSISTSASTKEGQEQHSENVPHYYRYNYNKNHYITGNDNHIPNVTMSGTIPPSYTSQSKKTTTSTSGNNNTNMAVGQYATLKRPIFTLQEINTFTSLVGDYNPIHTSYATNRGSTTTDASNTTSVANDNDSEDSEGVVVPGMLLTCLFSSILGSIIHGCIYRSQSIQFKSPIVVSRPPPFHRDHQKKRQYQQEHCIVASISVLQVKRYGRCFPDVVNHYDDATYADHDAHLHSSRKLQRPCGTLVTCQTDIHLVDHNNIITDQNNHPTHNDDNKIDDKSMLLLGSKIECVAGKAEVWIPYK